MAIYIDLQGAFKICMFPYCTIATTFLLTRPSCLNQSDYKKRKKTLYVRALSIKKPESIFLFQECVITSKETVPRREKPNKEIWIHNNLPLMVDI